MPLSQCLGQSRWGDLLLPSLPGLPREEHLGWEVHHPCGWGHGQAVGHSSLPGPSSTFQSVQTRSMCSSLCAVNQGLRYFWCYLSLGAIPLLVELTLCAWVLPVIPQIGEPPVEAWRGCWWLVGHRHLSEPHTRREKEARQAKLAFHLG